MSSNPYRVLGVSPLASNKQISKAYRRLAKRYHPDLNPGDTAAAEKMGQINLAYGNIKAMRSRGQDPWAQQAKRERYQTGRDSTREGRTRRDTRDNGLSPVVIILAAVVMFFLVRLVLSLLFGEFAGLYHGDPTGGYYSSPYSGYGTYESVPDGE